MFVGPAPRALEVGQVLIYYRLGPARPQSLERAGLRDLVSRADLHDLDRFGARLGMAVDPHHDPLSGLDPALQPGPAVRDLPLRPAALHARYPPPQLVALGPARLVPLFHPGRHVLAST